MSSSRKVDTAKLPKARPNYVLLLLGLALASVLVVVYVTRHSVFPPPIQAVIIAVSMVLILYGIYPVPAIRGAFGELSVAGPAALGVFIFLFVWKSLAATDDRRYVVIQNFQDLKLNTAEFPDGTAVTLLDVVTLSDNRLTSKLNEFRSAIKRGGISTDAEAEVLLHDFYKKIIQSLNFGAKESDAMSLFSRYLASANAVDKDWTELVMQVSKTQSNPQDYIKRVKREPFAIVKIREGNSIKIGLVLPGIPLGISDKEYLVPIIANPYLTGTRGIQEAIVLQVDK
jgi:hypothetical protein